LDINEEDMKKLMKDVGGDKKEDEKKKKEE
jgi:hypothetical protein